MASERAEYFYCPEIFSRIHFTHLYRKFLERPYIRYLTYEKEDEECKKLELLFIFIIIEKTLTSERFMATVSCR